MTKQEYKNIIIYSDDNIAEITFNDEVVNGDIGIDQQIPHNFVSGKKITHTNTIFKGKLAFTENTSQENVSVTFINCKFQKGLQFSTRKLNHLEVKDCINKEGMDINFCQFEKIKIDGGNLQYFNLINSHITQVQFTNVYIKTHFILSGISDITNLTFDRCKLAKCEINPTELKNLEFNEFKSKILEISQLHENSQRKSENETPVNGLKTINTDKLNISILKTAISDYYFSNIEIGTLELKDCRIKKEKHFDIENIIATKILFYKFINFGSLQFAQLGDKVSRGLDKRF